MSYKEFREGCRRIQGRVTELMASSPELEAELESVVCAEDDGVARLRIKPQGGDEVSETLPMDAVKALAEKNRMPGDNPALNQADGVIKSLLTGLKQST